VTRYQVTLDPETLQRLFTGDDSQVGELLEAILTQVLEAHAAERLQEAPYERTEQRQDSRNGSMPRRLSTRWGNRHDEHAHAANAPGRTVSRSHTRGLLLSGCDTPGREKIARLHGKDAAPHR
jgi:hypothetical protein